MHMEQAHNNENLEKNIVVLKYTKLDRYLNLEKKTLQSFKTPCE